MCFVKPHELTLPHVAFPAAFACLVWWHCSAYRRLDERDYAEKAGTLRFAEEKGKNKSTFLEFYLVESSIRFRISIEGYRECFDRRAFFANIAPGTKVVLTAKKSQLDEPRRPPLDPVDTVFVHGLKDEHMAYCTLSSRRDWEEKNQLYGIVLALFLTCVTIGLLAMYLRARSTNPLPAP